MINNISLKRYFSNDFKKDFFASIVVFLVAVPLCLGIALASGMPPAAGLISGIIGGIVVGHFSGCSLQVSGPAAGLVALVYEIIQEHGVEKLGVIILFSGLIQILFGVLKLGPWFRAVSPAIITGMLSGIGILILTSQFHVMVDDIPKKNAMENILSLPSAVIQGITISDDTTHHLAALIGLFTIFIMGIWRFIPKRFQVIPSALAGVIGSIIFVQLFNLPIKHIILPDNLFSQIKLPTLSSFQCLLSWGILVESLAIAFIASAETLISSVAVDQMQTQNKTNYSQEIIAQGIGNALCGFLGALPVTGVVVRSSANVLSGARTRISAILHGIWIFIFVYFFPHVLENIPTATLGAVLVYTGYKLIDLKAIRNLAKFGKAEVFICIITIVTIVFDSLLEGIIVGVVLSAIKLLYNFSYIKIEVDEISGKNEVTVVVHGCAMFINLPILAQELEKVEYGKHISICFENLSYIDHAAFDLIVNFQKRYESKGGTVTVSWANLESKFSQVKQKNFVSQ